MKNLILLLFIDTKKEQPINLDLANLILAKVNIQLTDTQKEFIIETVLEMEQKNALASEISFKILNFLQVPLLENAQNLTNIIAEHWRKNGNDVRYFNNPKK